ncbi:MAG TPA: DUF4865 family protein [Candidatus Dormibacteraeota bacterium]|jgi:hypothetical protein|nr:DUF4865 family protein [Candidatus Dormibacteraeota bacterium]
MYAMQYEITLPADYDMGIIRQRVATRGPLLDHFPGPGLKAYGIRERGRNGSPVNQYAPFYVWVSTDGMNRFLWEGRGFQGIVADFGRPQVRHWTGVDVLAGPARGSVPRAASRLSRPVPPGEDPQEAVARAADEVVAIAALPSVHTVALAVDPRDWELIIFTLWEERVEAGAGTRYEVLHPCRPELDALGPRPVR